MRCDRQASSSSSEAAIELSRGTPPSCPCPPGLTGGFAPLAAAAGSCTVLLVVGCCRSGATGVSLKARSGMPTGRLRASSLPRGVGPETADRRAGDAAFVGDLDRGVSNCRLRGSVDPGAGDSNIPPAAALRGDSDRGVGSDCLASAVEGDRDCADLPGCLAIASCCLSRGDFKGGFRRRKERRGPTPSALDAHEAPASSSGASAGAEAPEAEALVVLRWPMPRDVTSATLSRPAEPRMAFSRGPSTVALGLTDQS
mmetsp:Transcript_24600/g.73395  ORF Transcript_24600/g.73395 Transcript_24600/m.73395 type:complete len:256 (-) Transcript_24600:1178-1945(-)